MRRSRKVVPKELVTSMSWDPSDFLSCLVMGGWHGRGRIWPSRELWTCEFGVGDGQNKIGWP